MLFDWFSTKKVDEFARSLAQDLARRFPQASEARTDKGAQNQEGDVKCKVLVHLIQPGRV